MWARGVSRMFGSPVYPARRNSNLSLSSNSKIYIVGHRNAGKTSVANRLQAKDLSKIWSGVVFHCLDSEVEIALQCDIASYVAKHGERMFRAEETRQLLRLASAPGNDVIVCGGGTVEHNFSFFESRICIWIKRTLWASIREQTAQEQDGSTPSNKYRVNVSNVESLHATRYEQFELIANSIIYIPGTRSWKLEIEYAAEILERQIAATLFPHLVSIPQDLCCLRGSSMICLRDVEVPQEWSNALELRVDLLMDPLTEEGEVAYWDSLRILRNSGRIIVATWRNEWHGDIDVDRYNRRVMRMEQIGLGAVHLLDLEAGRCNNVKLTYLPYLLSVHWDLSEEKLSKNPLDWFSKQLSAAPCIDKLVAVKVAVKTSQRSDGPFLDAWLDSIRLLVKRWQWPGVAPRPIATLLIIMDGVDLVRNSRANAEILCPLTQSEELAVAPGQITIQQLRKQRAGTAMGLFTAVIGNDVSKSLSPQVHDRIISEEKLPAEDYSFMRRISTYKVEDILPVLNLPGCKGLAITIPFKESGFDMLHAALGYGKLLAAPCVTWAGCINTAVPHRDSVLCLNTDARAFLEIYQEIGDVTNVLVLGAGGTARAAIGALRELQRQRMIDTATSGAYTSRVSPWRRCSQNSPRESVRLESLVRVNCSYNTMEVTSDKGNGGHLNVFIWNRSEGRVKALIESMSPLPEGFEIVQLAKKNCTVEALRDVSVIVDTLPMKAEKLPLKGMKGHSSFRAKQSKFITIISLAYDSERSSRAGEYTEWVRGFGGCECHPDVNSMCIERIVTAHDFLERQARWQARLFYCSDNKREQIVDELFADS